MSFRYFISIIIFSQAPQLYGQNPPSQEIDIQSFVEEHFETQDADINYEELYESLFTFHSNPLDINKSTTEELRSLNILSEIQIKSLFNHLDSHGKLLSLYELQSIEYFDQLTVAKLIPFIKIGNINNISSQSLWQRIKNNNNNYLLIRYERTLETQQGFKITNDSTPARYSGDRGKYYTRFRTSHVNDFSLGFTAEKDAGEKFIWDRSTHRYGSDFQSFHLQIQQKGIVKNLILGDYQLQIGQGLLSSAGFSIGKGSETINTIRRNHLGLRPYTSVVESGFFRGIASTIQLKTLEFTTFYSQLNRDAILRSDTIENEEFVTSLQASGLHRTISEINAKQAITERVLGGNVAHLNKNKRLQLSATVIYTKYNTPLIVTPRYYNQFDFSDNQNLVLGISGSYQWRNINVFGEVGRSQSGGIGVVGGFLSSLTPKLDLALSFRHYSPDFHSLYGKAFGENITNKNENGTYWGLKYKHNKKLTFSAYYDTFRFPWLKSGVKSPSEGYEFLLRTQYKPSRKINFYIQYREELKLKSIDNEPNKIDILEQGIKRNFIVNADYKTSKVLTLKTRFQMSTYNFNDINTQGSTIIQDVTLNLGKFIVSGRYALFQTDDFENRQYVYEKDVLYAFSIPAYGGLGSRNYLLVQYKHNRKWHFWVRYAVTHYRDRKKIGSGLEEIDGNIKSALKLQLRIKF